LAEYEENPQKEEAKEEKPKEKPKETSSDVPQDSEAPKVEPPRGEPVQTLPPPPKPEPEVKEEKKEVPPPQPEPVQKISPPPKPEVKITEPPKEAPKKDQEVKAKEEVKTEEAPSPKKEEPKEVPKDKPKDHKEGIKAPSGDMEKPKEKKGGDIKERGKPKEGTKTKDKKDEFLTRLSPLIFGKYDLNEVVVEDPGLRRYINLQPVGLPHSGAKHANRSFGKKKVNIVERLINNMMRTEHSTGKKSFTYKTVSKSFDIIAKRTKQNPVQVLIHALQNSSPKEEITRLRFGGISVPKAVDTSASHRLDVALRNICKGAVSSSHKNKKRMEVCLAEEIILASKADMNSFAVSKKEEMERIAASAR
jgi:small subunit ribosomal protein S7